MVKSATVVSENSKSSSTRNNVETNSINSATTPRESPESPAMTWANRLFFALNIARLECVTCDFHFISVAMERRPPMTQIHSTITMKNGTIILKMSWQIMVNAINRFFYKFSNIINFLSIFKVKPAYRWERFTTMKALKPMSLHSSKAMFSRSSKMRTNRDGVRDDIKDALASIPLIMLKQYKKRTYVSYSAWSQSIYNHECTV